MTVVAVPEASVHLNHSAMLRENEVGSAGQLPIVKLVAESLPMQSVTKLKLDAGVLPADPGHHLTPLFPRNYVGHDVMNQAACANRFDCVEITGAELRAATMWFAIASETGGTTAFPNWR